MASPTDPEVRAFVRGSLIVQVATLSPKGRPFTTPLWFVDDGGALYVTTGAASRAGKNVGQHPAVVLLFSGERAAGPARCLRLRGTARCFSGLPSWRVLFRILAKYYLSPRALATELRNAHKWRLRLRYYGQARGGAGYIRVVPTAADFLARP
jgi:hypothetical protein